MRRDRQLHLLTALLALACAVPCGAQFSSNITGVVQDASGAVVPGVKVTLVNVGTKVERATETAASGVYRFSSLAPGNYEVIADAAGFQPQRIAVALLTAQTADVPFRLEIQQATERIEITSEAPVLATSDSRTQATIETATLNDLPLPSRNMLGLSAVAPGVTGYGSVGGGAPGDAPDNFSTETTIDSSGNGRNSSGNHYSIDGLNVTSNIIQGVTNLAPNPDSVQEVAIQTNTFSVENGVSSSIQVAVTTKSGTNSLRGTGSYYFTNQDMWARTVFAAGREPFKRHLFNGTLGGPVFIPKVYDGRNKTFFFGSFEALRSNVSASDTVRTFESPDFVRWAQQRFPDSIGTKVLTDRPVEGLVTTRVAQTAATVFGTGANGCGTTATYGIPCDMPMIMEGTAKPAPFRNALQFNIRADQYLNNGNDRLYFNYYDTTLDTEAVNFRRGFSTVNDNLSHAVQANWTHTFSPAVLNEFSFGWIKVLGNSGLDPSIPQYIPDISVDGMNQGIAPPWGPATFIQNNYNWRNVVSVIKGSHSLKFGFQAWSGNDDALFNGVNGRTSFRFLNLLELVTDDPFSQGGPQIDPLTGREGPGGYEHRMSTFGFFVQDEWKVKPNLTLSLGVRWDDYGNITRNRDKGVPLGNAVLPARFKDLDSPAAINAAFAQARFVDVDSGVYDGRITNVWSPRVGFAWDPTRNGEWALRGGFGLYHDWIPLGEANRIRGNPPGLLRLALTRGDPTPPVFSLGTSSEFPFGWTLPQLPAYGVNEYGGLEGIRSSTGALDRYLRPSDTYIWNIGVERKLGEFVAGAMYSGSKTTGGIIGTDFNRFAGDLLDGSFDRLHSSFGTIFFESNLNEITYNAMILSLRSRWRGANFQSSYTFSKTEDFGQAGSRVNRDPGYATPSQHNLEQFKAAADWDFRHRFSLSGVFDLPGPKSGALRMPLGGWQLSTLWMVQSGPPFNVISTAPFRPVRDADGKVTGLLPNSGDFNADGVNWDIPNMPSTDFTGSHSRQQYLNGLFRVSDFPLPTPGTLGNLPRMYYRGPGMINGDVGVLKRFPLTEQVNLQLRFEFFNVLNRVNLRNVTGDMNNSNFGRSTSQFRPRVIQLGARLSF
ncbi:MAG: TonB-dependent receptor [Bryobacteraceae bacterium]|nr:TonB-dependent receptor [Bryobacteraceae bacterium]